MVESLQEIITPSIVLRNQTDFERTRQILKDYRGIFALVKHVQVSEIIFQKKVDGKDFAVSNVVHLYFGVYDSSTKPANQKDSRIFYYQIDDLTEEMKESPELFTNDLTVLVKRFEIDLRNFIDQVAA